MLKKNQNTWFITGASKGLGLAITKVALANGDNVVATSRNPEVLRMTFPNEKNLLAVQVDLASFEEVQQAVQLGVEKFHSIQVVINNAAYILGGSLEELTDHEFRQTMDINFFGTLNVIRAVMPYLRLEKSGHVINISSNAGYVGMAGVGSYNASKFAVVGISEALYHEVKPLGINVTVVAPGQFRTNLWEPDSIKFGQNLVKDYNTEAVKTFVETGNGKQPGDPKKLAKILLKIVTEPDPPLHLLLGKDTYEMIAKHREEEKIEFETWKPITLSTDF